MLHISARCTTAVIQPVIGHSPFENTGGGSFRRNKVIYTHIQAHAHEQRARKRHRERARDTIVDKGAVGTPSILVAALLQQGKASVSANPVQSSDAQLQHCKTVSDDFCLQSNMVLQ